MSRTGSSPVVAAVWLIWASSGLDRARRLLAGRWGLGTGRGGVAAGVDEFVGDRAGIDGAHGGEEVFTCGRATAAVAARHRVGHGFAHEYLDVGGDDLVEVAGGVGVVDAVQ